jgi:hypothetical protein
MSRGIWFNRKHKHMKSFFFAFFGLIAVTAFAQAVPDLYQGADLKLGEKLIADSQCDACHIRNVGGNGYSIYRPAGRVNSLGALRGQVEACNTMLNLGLFPEEVTSISAVLNRDHYRFK